MNQSGKTTMLARGNFAHCKKAPKSTQKYQEVLKSTRKHPKVGGRVEDRSVRVNNKAGMAATLSLLLPGSLQCITV